MSSAGTAYGIVVNLIIESHCAYQLASFLQVASQVDMCRGRFATGQHIVVHNCIPDGIEASASDGNVLAWLHKVPAGR